MKTTAATRAHLRTLLATCTLLATTALAGTASAAALQLDFGSVDVTSADATNSPLHTVDGTFTDTSWNKIVHTVGQQTNLLYSNGTAATGVSVYVGRSSGLADAWKTLTLAGAATNSTSNPNPGGLDGVFASSTSIGRDGIYGATGGGTPDRITGVAIGGLAAGTYDIYIVGLNPNLALTDASMGFWAAEQSVSGPIVTSGSGATTFDFTTLIDNGPQAVSTNSVSSTWVEGSNYVKLTVTLASSDSYLTIFSHGLTGTEQRGFLNAIQIVPIPEPATISAIAGLSILFVAFVIRRVRR